MRGRRPDDRGSIAVELAFVAPIFLLLLSLLYAYARVSQVNGTLDAGTRDAARAASQARTIDDAQEQAEEIVRSSLGSGGSQRCLDTLQARVVGAFAAGVPVKVRSTCRYSLDDLGLPGVPGEVTVSSSFTSPVDPGRGLTPGNAPG